MAAHRSLDRSAYCSLDKGGVLARSHGLVFSSAAGGAHWQIAIRCPSLPFPSVKVHQAAVLVRRFCSKGGGVTYLKMIPMTR